MPSGILPVELEKLTASSFGGTRSKNLAESPKNRKDVQARPAPPGMKSF